MNQIAFPFFMLLIALQSVGRYFRVLYCTASLNAVQSPSCSWPAMLDDYQSDSCLYVTARDADGIYADLQGFTYDGGNFWATVETTDHPIGSISTGA